MEFFRRLQKSSPAAVETKRGNPGYPQRIQQLQHVPMDPAVRANLEQLVKTKSAEFVAFCTSTKAAKAFKLLGKQHNVELYGGQVRGHYVVKGITTLPGNVHDVLATIQLDTTTNLTKTMQTLLGKIFVQGMTLHTVPTTQTVGSLGLHWLSVHSNRQVCEAEECDAEMVSYSQLYEADINYAMELTATTSNSPSVIAGTHIWESTNILQSMIQVKPIKSAHRVNFRTSGFYVEKTTSDRGLTDQVVRLTFVLSTDIPSRHQRGIQIQRWLRGIVSVITQNISRAARQSTTHLIARSKWIYTMSCSLCKANFRLFRRRHHCRLCGQSVCNACSCIMDLDYPVLPNGDIVRHATVRSCTQCAFDNNTIVHRFVAGQLNRCNSVPDKITTTQTSRIRSRPRTSSHADTTATVQTINTPPRISSSYIDYSDSECEEPMVATRVKSICTPISEYRPLDRAERVRRRTQVQSELKPVGIKLIADDLLEELLMTTTQSQDEDDSHRQHPMTILQDMSLSSRGAKARQEEKMLETEDMITQLDYGDALSSKRYSARSEDMITLDGATANELLTCINEGHRWTLSSDRDSLM
ncbi:cleavage induced hypothetical protein [Thraustotheca clavata]|uniref:FYVE-type domain-containing protein n=1 Tax=Thraustotheca clavata TaxID=74557 RepID=A0A1V9YTP6_9STRA|nr:cleavage induced hypothetical protein [Thraustotheca clavata]